MTIWFDNLKLPLFWWSLPSTKRGGNVWQVCAKLLWHMDQCSLLSASFHTEDARTHLEGESWLSHQVCKKTFRFFGSVPQP